MSSLFGEGDNKEGREGEEVLLIRARAPAAPSGNREDHSSRQIVES
jgi:hypothetical protein